jgi:hypothetical protein
MNRSGRNHQSVQSQSADDERQAHQTENAYSQPVSRKIARDKPRQDAQACAAFFSGLHHFLHVLGFR